MPHEYPREWDVAAWRAVEEDPAVAHRGAPSDHTRSEFSFNTYDNAFANGRFKAGELSSHFSVDDVMLANHDPDTNDQYTTNLTIATSTAAALQLLTRRYGDTAEPMRTTQAVLERYPDKVWLVENKAYGASSGNWTAFFDLLLAQPNALNRIVFKAFYDASSRLAQAKALGFTTWAYCFGSAGADDLIDNYFPLGDIDWVGFSSGPSNDPTDQVYFDWAATNGVPVIAHIMEVSGDWTAAKAQGAEMGMVNDFALWPLT